MSIDNTMDLIEETSLDSIAGSVYHINQELTDLQLKGLIKHEYIVYVEVQEIRGDETIIISAGESDIRRDIIREFTLYHKSPGREDSSFGKILVVANLNELINSVRNQVLYIFTERIVIIFLLSIIIFLLTEYSITQHLSFIANYTKTLDLDNLDNHLSLTRKKNKSKLDEFDILVGSINEMQGRIDREIQERNKEQKAKEKLEIQYNQAQKMESIGRLAGGVAHDLNNLLTPILVYSELLGNEFENGTPVKKYSECIMDAGERARVLVGQLLSFSRKSPMKYSVVDLNELISNIEKLLRRTIRENIKFKVFLSVEPQMIMADGGQIEQILVNLIVNAQDAIKGEGVLTIETKMVFLDIAYTNLHPEIEPGNYVMMSVSDTGGGISQELQSQIFEPFFSTKGELGTGLGLATVFGIIKQHNGSIFVYSEIEKGTTFKVYLPLHAGTESQLSEPDIKKESSEQATESILLVEDDQQIRALTTIILESEGYTLYIAESGEAALEIMSQPHSKIHLLFTDVILPGMNGKELFEKVNIIEDDIKVLYMSGYTENIITFQDAENQSFIQKPFSRLDLLEKVRVVLNKD